MEQESVLNQPMLTSTRRRAASFTEGLMLPATLMETTAGAIAFSAIHSNAWVVVAEWHVDGSGTAKTVHTILAGRCATRLAIQHGVMWWE